MSGYFGDASYWIALSDEADEYHHQATEYSALLELDQARIVTTQLVLNEVLNPRSGTTRTQRRAAVNLVDRITRNPRILIEPQTSNQFDEAFEWMRNRLDKEWSITDCASFLVMQRDGIAEALTSDRHFEQAGYIALLR